MNIAKNSVATINYELKDGDGATIDSSAGQDPLAYIHGVGMLVPGLEKALEGKEAGASVQVVIPPEEGYGERQDNLMVKVPKEQFENTEGLEVGHPVQAQGPDGVQILHVMEIGEDNIVLDGNHPLAGVTLHFAVDVVSVREATSEELEHGHVNGPGGHDH